MTRDRPESAIDLLIPLLEESPDLSVLEDGPRWKMVREQAGRHGVAALVANAVSPHVSGEDRSWCDRILIGNWVRYERMLRELENVLKVLIEEEIPAIALKGPLLAQRYYDPAFLRKSSGDLDLAVTEENLGRACDALARAGYKQDAPLSMAVALSHHVTLSHASLPSVELHYRLSHLALGIPVNQFFERTVSCRLPGGLEARVLGPADQLLHLALHLAQSRFGTLFYLYEIRRAYGSEPSGVQAEALKIAVDHHFSGAIRMIDVAFRVRWNQPFLPPEAAVPTTWLNGCLNEKLYRAFERWSLPNRLPRRGLTLARRLQGRWLDIQITDRPSDAIRLAALFAKTARAYVADRRAWGTV